MTLAMTISFGEGTFEPQVYPARTATATGQVLDAV
jgi:hypothetical protein